MRALVDEARRRLVARGERGLDADAEIGNSGQPRLKESKGRLLGRFSSRRRRRGGAPLMVDIVLGEQIGESRHVMRAQRRSEEHTSELQSRSDLVCRLL